MQGSTSNNPIPEHEILIGRIMDGEASEDDRARFELLAAADAQMWRQLAMRQQDMLLLAEKLDERLKPLERIDLPSAASSYRLDTGTTWRRMAAYSGWAAALALAVAWGYAGGNFRGAGAGNSTSRVVPITNGSAGTMTPDEHLQTYLKAPFVLGEMTPTLLEVETLSDGRKAVRFLRRIEEVMFLPTNDDVPVDADGNLTRPPAELRGGEGDIAEEIELIELLSRDETGSILTRDQAENLAIGALLMIGAVINVAVAWSAVFWDFLSDQSEQQGRATLSADFIWVVDRRDSVATTAVLTRAVPPGLVEAPMDDDVRMVSEVTPRWLGLNQPPPIESYYQFVYVRGWPCRSLYCETIVDSTDGSGMTMTRRHGIDWPLDVRSPNILDTLSLTGNPTLPVGIVWPGFVINTLCYSILFATFIGAPWLGEKTWRRRRRLRRGLCPSCEYPIGINPLCTECGRPVPHRSLAYR